MKIETHHHFRIVESEFKDGYYAQKRVLWVLWNPLNIRRRKTIEECEDIIEYFVEAFEIKNWSIRYKCNEL